MTKHELQLYLDRIDCAGVDQPTYQTLAQLHRQHLLVIPFENLDIHVPTPIVLDADKIFDKIVKSGRGGFCYELNGLFYELLVTLGFNVKRVSARVIDKEGNYPPEFDHLALLVDLGDETFLADVGCGEFILEPLLFQLDTIQSDLAGTFIIDQFEDRYRVSKIIDGELEPEYTFTTISRQLDEFDARCVYQQSDPNSHFMKKRMITRPTTNGRISIAGQKLKITEGAETEEVLLADEQGFHGALEQYFNIVLDR